MKTTKFNNKNILIYFVIYTMAFEMITNDNTHGVCISSSVSLLYLFGMIP